MVITSDVPRPVKPTVYTIHLYITETDSECRLDLVKVQKLKENVGQNSPSCEVSVLAANMQRAVGASCPENRSRFQDLRTLSLKGRTHRFLFSWFVGGAGADTLNMLHSCLGNFSDLVGMLHVPCDCHN